MKPRVVFFSFLFCSIFFAGCGKQGCTDSVALNYDNAAKNDDGNCKYFVDEFLGNYKGPDTTTLIINTDTTFSPARTISFQVKRIKRNKIYFNNFLDYSVASPFEMFSLQFSVVDSTGFPVIAHGDFRFNNDTVFYQSASFNGTNVWMLDKGFAVKTN